MSITDYPKDLICTNTIRQDPWILPAMEAIAYAVEIINKNPSLLPNVSLGFVIVDYCRSSNIALSQTLSFLPVASSKNKFTLNNTINSSISVKQTRPLSKFTTTIPPTFLSSSTPSFKPIPHYDVVGVLGPQASTSTVYMSSLLSVARLPMISYMATGDELSNKYNHPYLLRLVPPDKHQVQGMLTFIADNGWTYISVVHGDTTYGDTAFERIKVLAPKFDICLATSHRVGSNTDFDSVIKNLLSHETARVVILFAETDPILNLLAASHRAGAKGHFIWIGSDSLSDKIISRGKYIEELYGTFTFMYYSKPVPAFEKYFKELRPNSTTNPWFKPFWQMLAQCSFSNNTCWSQTSIDNFQKISIPPSISLIIDSVFTFAYGIHNLLSDLCPSLAGHDARLCVNGNTLLNYMLNYSFNGFTSKISFDKNGDLIGKYFIRQMLYENESGAKENTRGKLVETQVGCYEVKDGSISYRGPLISWDHLKFMSPVFNLSESGQRKKRPESVCSHPCNPDQYMIQRELRCCWECGSCRANEKLVKKRTACEKCPQFTWPDPESNLTRCIPIPPSYPCIYDTMSAVEICLAGLCTIFLCCMAALYVRFREHSVIKAASRELSAIQMMAIFWAYITVILLQIMPTNTVCGIIYFLFCLSFTCLYSPLIVKAIRIYRIFLQGSRCNKNMRCISPQSQLLIAGLLITVQMLVSAGMFLVHRPSAHLSQPVELEKFVELHCDFTMSSLISFLAISLLQVPLLPDNFKESRFVSMCASTTLIIWLAVVPAYYTASLKHTRTLLLSLALLLNHTVALIFLFVPKVFAIYYVDYETESISKLYVSQLKKKVSFPDVCNRVMPTSTKALPF
ncbi:unnamed protein product [Candidula unifasciata]|uniref:G-protein coupled receptors family 3 profile domain-containing protein n=1 Tax=Candidula unifasciata TaxID=100452 RepID=A0A8S3ZR17_9EUPU|nr:unnamed protein product [Candidula unifasciata]